MKKLTEAKVVNEMISSKYLREHPDHVFVFGDNTTRLGKKGGALLRDEPNAYGFITKKYPTLDKDSYFKVSEYRRVFYIEMLKLELFIQEQPQKTFLISKIGSGLADKYGIWKTVIQNGLESLRIYSNVKFLWEAHDEQ